MSATSASVPNAETAEKSYLSLPGDHDYRLIPVSQGLISFVDSWEFDRLSAYPWSPLRTGNLIYAISHDWVGGRRVTLYMHRLVLNAPRGVRVDHREPSQTLDNRHFNLRLATNSQNIANSRPRNGRRFKGVTARANGTWQVECAKRHVGTFNCPVKAAQAYDVAAIEAHGEFARLNFPPPSSPETPTNI